MQHATPKVVVEIDDIKESGIYRPMLDLYLEIYEGIAQVIIDLETNRMHLYLCPAIRGGAFWVKSLIAKDASWEAVWQPIVSDGAGSGLDSDKTSCGLADTLFNEVQEVRSHYNLHNKRST